MVGTNLTKFYTSGLRLFLGESPQGESIIDVDSSLIVKDRTQLVM